MLFSVIVPTYNRAPLLAQALASIRDQRCKDYEVIVVDDGSTDHTPSVLAEHPWARSLRLDNGGPGRARNHAARQATGEYLAFLDSDDLWFPWTLAIYGEVISTTHSPAFVAGRSLDFRQPADICARQDHLEFLEFGDYLTAGDQWRWHGASSFVVRADAFRRSGGFNEIRMNAEDADLALRLGDAAGFVQITSPCTFAYRRHQGNVTSDVDLSIRGAWAIIEREESNAYPGGPGRRLSRRKIITRHLRPLSLECLRAGRLKEGWRLFSQTFAWNFRDLRFRYLAGYPAMLVASSLRVYARRERRNTTPDRSGPQ